MNWSRFAIVAALACVFGCAPPPQKTEAPPAATQPEVMRPAATQPEAPPSEQPAPPQSASNQKFFKVTPTWLKFPGEPGPRYAIDMVWDSAARRVLLYGGANNTESGGQSPPTIEYFGDLWAWYPDTAVWEKLVTQGVAPDARAYYAAAYDSKRNGMWIHGGSRGYALGDMWFFDCEASTWRRVEIVATEQPEIRAGHTLHYNPKTDELYLFGGVLNWDTMKLSHEFWALDCRTREWSRKPLGPLARFMHLAALDYDDQKYYITGGFGLNAQPVDEKLWVYDVTSGIWQGRDDTVGSKVLAGRMVYVPSRGFLDVLCGNDYRLERRYDLKEQAWSTAKYRSSLPPRGFHGMALDPEENRLFICGGTFGGFFGTCVAGDMWMRSLESDEPTLTPMATPQDQSPSPSP